MTEAHLNPYKKGALGEALVFGGQRPPRPVLDTVETFVKENYNVVEDTPVRISTKRGLYYRLMTSEGDELTTQPDGGLVAEWIPPENAEKLERDREGRVRMRDQRELSDRTVVFPVEVKTGEYAELERDQKEVLEGIAASEQEVHPIVVQVDIRKLPDRYDVDVRFL